MVSSTNRALSSSLRDEVFKVRRGLWEFVMEPLFLGRVPSHLRQHILSDGILKDLGERPQVTGPPHSSTLGTRGKDDPGDTPAPHTHTGLFWLLRS